MKIYYNGTTEKLSLALEQLSNDEVALVLKDQDGKIRKVVAVIMQNGALFRCNVRNEDGTTLPVKLNSEGRIFVCN